jgi:uncharacterized membrane protein
MFVIVFGLANNQGEFVKTISKNYLKKEASNFLSRRSLKFGVMAFAATAVFKIGKAVVDSLPEIRDYLNSKQDVHP